MVSPRNLDVSARSLVSRMVNLVKGMLISMNSSVTSPKVSVMFFLVVVPFFTRYALLSSIPSSVVDMNSMFSKMDDVV